MEKLLVCSCAANDPYSLSSAYLLDNELDTVKAGVKKYADMIGASEIMYFLVEGSILALGAGCIASGLYLAAFLGGGMLLYETLPRSTEKAIRAASSYNAARIKEFYLPVFETLKQFPKIQEKPMP